MRIWAVKHGQNDESIAQIFLLVVVNLYETIVQIFFLVVVNLYESIVQIYFFLVVSQFVVD